MRVVRFSSDDPFLNLAAERHLFETGDPAEELLILYVNRASVVIGRSQNPLRECDLALLEHEGLPMVRRYTGGGTVYHDPGNLNFSIIRPRESYDKFENSRQLLVALSTLGISGGINERNDLLFGERKFSGSAYRLTRARALHHGTLLVSADLPLLRRALKPTLPGIEGKGVLSVSSPVIALAEIFPGLTVEGIATTLAGCFGHGEVERVLPDDTLYRESAAAARELASWEWSYGRTPRFFVPLMRASGPVRCEVLEGRIVACEPSVAGELIGKKIDQLWNLFAA